MEKVTVETSAKYDVLIGKDLLEKAGLYLSSVLTGSRLCLASDETVFGLYGETVSASLGAAGYDTVPFVFAPGEKSKNMSTVCALLEFMAKERFTREDAVVALGGGVPGDIAGFAASCYMRGIPFVQIPTTLLSAVDSSVGGKTGVNLSRGKNLAGAFWQPSLVICDCGAFDTLPAENLRDGVAEIIKYGVIADRGLFDLMSSNTIESLLKDNLFEQIIKKCVIIKGGIVASDERDRGKRQILNFGHTIGHAIEKLSEYKISHGHAIALGMLFISRAGARSGISPASGSDEIEQVLRRYDFPLSSSFTADELYEAALTDKKMSGDSIVIIVPDGIGACKAVKIDMGLFKEFVGRGF